VICTINHHKWQVPSDWRLELRTRKWRLDERHSDVVDISHSTGIKMVDIDGTYRICTTILASSGKFLGCTRYTKYVV
jgi:hypothetical protein